ncbi:hypothetical protein ACJRO7_024012 [Eucalyptus globulus]|uniref:F-box domain-containing protein n=1 Tax=Eucalyptus globulus TaxID=34317 RepID=A0ABD3K926_EUCGL
MSLLVKNSKVLQVRIRMMNELDKISQLPRHIMDQILSRLPIEDAMRTSISVKKVEEVLSLQPSLHENLAKIIDKVLLLHTGPIQKFMLSHEEFCALSGIDHWILHLSRVSVKEIIPTSLFNCQNLIHLGLYRCLVKISSRFAGLKNLESLDLRHIELSSDGLKALIFSLPPPKTAGNLEWLDVGEAFQDVAFSVMNSLKSVTVGFSDDIANKYGPGNANSNKLHKLFRNLPQIQSLNLENYSLKYSAVGDVLQTPPNELVHMNYLCSCIDLNSVKEILTIMCLIRCSPQLKHLDFRDLCDEVPKAEPTQLPTSVGSKQEQEMMKFLLASKLLRDLPCFWRALAQEEVIFLDPVDRETYPH